MTVVFAENTNGTFKKSAFEAVSYGYAVSKMTGTGLTAISIGNVNEAELQKLSNYGASKIISINNSQLSGFNAQAYATAIAQAMQKVGGKTLIVSASFSGKGLVPRIAVKLNGGLAENVVDLPNTTSGFVVKKGAYSGKAFAMVEMMSDVKVISIIPNSYKTEEHKETATIESMDVSFGANDFAMQVKETIRSSDKISLPDAELVVSAGRGMKGPENWGMIEELANILGAATACSKPVSDAGWRPHSEHVGQTGIAISPNLYIAVGISGAIQHLAGVSSSKVIVVVNKDPEAPFFKAADYGIVGDAFEVLPKLIEAAKSFKAAHN